MSIKKLLVTLSILVLKIFAAVYQDCGTFLATLGFNATSIFFFQNIIIEYFNFQKGSVCLINQGHPNTVSEFSQYLSSTYCLNILSNICSSSLNYTSGPNCMSNSLISVIYSSNQYFSKAGFYIKGSVNTATTISQTGPSIYVNNVAQSYNSTSFTKYCTNYFYNIYNKIVPMNTNQLNLTFSALPITQKALQTIYSAIIVALQYCPNYCTSCDDNACYSCQQGYYPGGLNCLQCDQSCLKCLPSCQACSDGQSCTSCIVGYYLANNICNKCDSSCASCKGPRYVMNGSTCQACGQGYFMDNNNICIQCHISCAYCNGPNQNQCTTCLQKGYFISIRQNNICVPICDLSQAQFINLTINPLQQYCSQCSTLCQTCQDSQNCTSCIQGYYLLQNKCYKCDTTCQSCTGPGPNNCLVCSQPGYYISQKDNNICVAQCDINQSFYVDSLTNPNQNICKQCSLNCLICSSSTNCSQCQQGFYLNGNICSPCMQGYYQNGNQCLPCDSSCKICSGPGSNNCIICSNSNYFISEAQNNQCVAQCLSNQAQYIDSTTNFLQNYCRQCPQSCQTCKNGNICTSCQYYDGIQCLACDNSCQLCNGPAKTDCIQCKDNFYYQQTTSLCVANCGSNEYKQNQNCIKCDISCSSCLSLQNCQQCNCQAKLIKQYQLIPKNITQHISSYEQYGFKVIYTYAVFWMAQVFTIISFGLFVLGRHLDFKTQSLNSFSKEKYNLQMETNIENQLKQNKDILHIQLQQLDSKNEVQLSKVQNKSQAQDNFNDQKILSSQNEQKSEKMLNLKQQNRKKFVKFVNYQENINQLEKQEDYQQNDIKQNSINGQTQKIKQNNKMDQIEDIQDSQNIQNIANIFNRHSFVKKLLIFHPTFGIYYIFNSKISRSARFSLFYIKIIHSMALSIQFQDSIQNIQQILIGFLNGCLVEFGSFMLSILFQQGKFGKILSIVFQVFLGSFYYYSMVAFTQGKKPSDSNQFIQFFAILMSINILAVQTLVSILKIIIIKLHTKINSTVIKKICNLLKLKQDILNIDD
ncbi:hypothetical protein ABPG74_001393 [Tetrahymena malaccensis]